MMSAINLLVQHLACGYQGALYNRYTLEGGLSLERPSGKTLCLLFPFSSRSMSSLLKLDLTQQKG